MDKKYIKLEQHHLETNQENQQNVEILHCVNCGIYGFVKFVKRNDERIYLCKDCIHIENPKFNYTTFGQKIDEKQWLHSIEKITYCENCGTKRGEKIEILISELPKNYGYTFCILREKDELLICQFCNQKQNVNKIYDRKTGYILREGEK